MSGSTAARYQQHQQQLMQKLHASSPSHYSNTPSNVGQAGPHGPPPHHHPSFAYPGPPASPAGYPGYGGGPGHTPHGGPPGPPGSHLGGAGGPSPGIHGHPSASGMTPGGGHAGHGAGPQSQASGQSSHHAIHHGGHLGSQSQQNHQLNGHTGGHHVSHSSVQHPSQHHQSHQHHQQHQHVNGGSNNGGLNNSNDRNQNSSLNLNNSTSPHWQQQIAFANASRQSTSAHHHARAAHLQQRGVTTAGSVTVGDPSRHPVMSIGRPSKEAKEEKANGTLHKKGESHGAEGSPVNTAAAIEAEREKTGQAWTTIDMGGMHLRNLSAELFRYTFLTTLYVPHNNLTSLPSALSTLAHLILLDASGNKLASIPPELGMLTSLRELLLFDNQLTTLPPELGTLHQLDILGIEGNPLPDNLRSLMEKEGTSGLIAYLRDSCPVPLPPPDREWITVEADTFPSVADAGVPEPETFSVLCYNVLCEKYATAQMYGYTPSWALNWEYRKELILQEILGYGADIICLQEVDVEQYEEFFLHHLSQQGYEGLHCPKTRARTMSAEEKRHVDGCATFYKASTFQLVEQHFIEFNQIAMRRPDFKKTEDMFNRVMTKDHIAVLALLEHKQSGARLIAANVHVEWRPEFRDVKLVQVAMLMEEIGYAADHFAKLPPKLSLGKGYDKAPTYTDGTKIPTVICGDFNSVPGESGVYQFLASGTIGRDHEDFMDHVYGNYTSDGLHHKFSLKSSYSHLDASPDQPKGGLNFTNYTPGFRGVIDYIWYTTSSLSVTGLLGEVEPSYLSKVVGFPNAHFPSDHISILAELKIKPQNQTTNAQSASKEVSFRR